MSLTPRKLTIIWLFLALLMVYFIQLVQDGQLECEGKVNYYSNLIYVIINCTVLVRDPWPKEYLAVTQGSTVRINCTANYSDNLFWTIDLGNDSTTVQYQFNPGYVVLNAHGLYELSRIETTDTITLRLLVNDTALNNQTNVLCYRSMQALTTTLFVYSRLIESLN